MVPDILTLEPDLAWHENRSRMAGLLVAFLALAALEGLVVGLLADAVLVALPVAVILALGYLASGVRYGDTWIQAALAASPDAPPAAKNLLEGTCAAAGLSPPALFVGPGEAPNALALGLGRRWILLTPGATRLGRLELEAMLAHEVAHLRDGDGALASAFVYLSGAPELALRALHSPRGFLAFLSLPLWPVSLVIRAARPLLFGPVREHRADVVGALMTRYPPGMRGALAAAGVEQGAARLRLTDHFWFAPRTPVAGPDMAERLQLVAEM